MVVLSYNNEQYLEDCLSSIERQGIDSYEVFVIDDSSTDNSVEVIKYSKDKPQFNLIVKPKFRWCYFFTNRDSKSPMVNI